MHTVGVFANIFDPEGRILCVKRNYGPRNWTTPGGRLEKGESPLAALEREVLEETGYRIAPQQLVGIYANVYKDDVVISICACIVGQEEWSPNGEIAEIGFFSQDRLPEPMSANTLTRIRDAFAGKSGVVRAFESV